MKKNNEKVVNLESGTKNASTSVASNDKTAATDTIGKKEKKGFYLPIKRKVSLKVLYGILTAVVILILCSANMFMVGHNIKKLCIKENKDKTSATLSSCALGVNKWLYSYASDLRAYTDTDITREGDSAKIISWLNNHRYLRNPDYLDLCFVDKNGTGHFDMGYETPYGTFKNDAIFTDVVGGKVKWLASDAKKVDETDEPIVSIGRAVKDKNDNIIGEFVAMVTSKTISKEINKNRNGKSGYFFICDGNGMIISHPSEKILFRNISEWPKLKELADKKNLVMASMQLDGVDVEVGAIPIPETNWILFSKVDKAEVLNSGKLTRILSVLFAVFIETIVFLGVFWIVTSLVNRVHTVDYQLKSLNEGNADLTKKLNVLRNDDLGQLAIHTNDFISKFRDIVITIKESGTKIADTDKSLQEQVNLTKSTVDEVKGSVVLVRE